MNLGKEKKKKRLVYFPFLNFRFTNGLPLSREMKISNIHDNLGPLTE